MRHRTLLLLVLFALAAGCGGDGGLGESCSTHGDCDSELQCSASVCVPRCARAPDCGDGYACDRDGICQLASGQPGDDCTSEVECAPGLACQLDGESLGENQRLLASCTPHSTGRPAGAECAIDGECRNGTCALGHCIDLCASDRDCNAGFACLDIPRVEARGSLFTGCLPSQGNIQWTIPVQGPTANILFPVPSGAHSAQLVFSVEDAAQRVGAQSVTSPSGDALFAPCNLAMDPECDPINDYYQHVIRHQPLFGQSVITLPTTPAVPLETGAYKVGVASFRPSGSIGSAIPHVRASVRIDAAVLLDLHFYFLNFEDHMCSASLGGTRFDSTAAQNATFFQTEFLGALRGIFAPGGIALGTITYQDVLDHPDLDGLDVTDAGKLLELGEHAGGINVFFVRTLSPVGLQAFGPNPGPAGLAGTRQSGVIIGLDSLCYRSWAQLARLTAHELARYMGLHHNVEAGADAQNPWRDLLDDTDDSETNLMFYSEFGGLEITQQQRDILTRSGALR